MEFKKLPEILSTCGPDGITELVMNPHLAVAEVTDDTQMTLSTSEEVPRGIHRRNDRGIGDPESTLLQAYRRWLLAQESMELVHPVSPGELNLLLGRTLAKPQRQGVIVC